MARVVITGAAGFIGSHLAEALLDRGDSVVGIDNLLTGDTANIAHLAGRDFQFIKHDVTNYIYVDGHGRLRAALGQPGQPDRLPRAADPDAEGGRARHAQGARPGQGQGRALHHRLDLRGLRRSARAPAEGILLGQRQPGRPARRLRRSQALRRGDDHGLPPLPRRRHEDRPHLQHLRPAHAPQRRPRRAGLHEPGAAATRTSRSSATAARRAASATSATWSTASSR